MKKCYNSVKITKFREYETLDFYQRFKSHHYLDTISIFYLGGVNIMSNFKPGKINKHILHSNILERDVTLSVYLPED